MLKIRECFGKNNRSLILGIVWCVILDAFIFVGLSLSACGRPDSGKSDVKEKYLETVSSSEYIIHALGGMDGEKSYINSIDCLETAYQKGFRLFEADVSFTSDDRLVLAHSGENNVWSKNDWDKRFGQPYPFEKSEGETDEEYDKRMSVLRDAGYDIERHLCPYDVFMGFKIQDSFAASDFSQLLDFMESHPDIFVMVDAGHRDYNDTLKFYQKIVEMAGDRKELLDRLIAGGQTLDMVNAARRSYPFPLINLYFDSDEKREESISEPEDFVRYCKENDITSFSTAKEYYTKENAEVLEKSSLISYVFTVNDEEEKRELEKRGADVIGTDFLWDR